MLEVHHRRGAQLRRLEAIQRDISLSLPYHEWWRLECVELINLSDIDGLQEMGPDELRGRYPGLTMVDAGDREAVKAVFVGNDSALWVLSRLWE